MLSHTVCATLLIELGKDVTTRGYEYLKTVSTIYDTKGLARAATCCNAFIFSIILFLPPARLSEIYAFSYCVHHIDHRTGPKEVLEGVENRCQTFLTTYKQLNHIPDTIASRIWSKLLKIFVID